MNTKDLQKYIASTQSNHDQTVGQLTMVRGNIAQKRGLSASLQARKLDLKIEAEILDAFQVLKNDQVKRRFEEIITKALEYVFGTKGFSFALEFTKRGNIPECHLNIKTPELDKAYDPMDTEAGTVMDIVSLALRIAIMETSRPKFGGILTLDEPFKHVSADYLERVHEFLNMIVHSMKRQVVMCTHHESEIYVADHKIAIGNSRGE